MSSRDEAVKVGGGALTEEAGATHPDAKALWHASAALVLDAAHGAGLIVWADEAAAYCTRCGEPTHRESS